MVNLEAEAQEIIEILWEVLWNRRVLFISYFEEGSPWLELVVRWLLCQKFNDGAAQAPNVTGSRHLLLFLYDLRGHPVGRSRERHIIDGYLTIRSLRGVQLWRGHAKVCKLDLALLGGQDVSALDVSVDDALLMQKYEALKDLVYVQGDKGLGYLAELFYKGVQGAVLDVLENYVEVLLRLYAVKVLDYSLVLKISEQAYLILHWALQVLLDVVEWYLLDGN